MLKIFVKKWLEIVLITSFYYITDLESLCNRIPLLFSFRLILENELSAKKFFFIYCLIVSMIILPEIFPYSLAMCNRTLIVSQIPLVI